MSGLRLTPNLNKEHDESVRSSAAGLPITHTLRPMVTGSSIIGLRCSDGIVLASDTLASYGSLARFRQISRFHQATDHCVLGFGGDISDFQQLKRTLEQATTSEYCYNDGHLLSPKAIHQYLARIMYNRRNKMDPLWNHIIVGGWQNDKPMLGLVNLVGTHFETEVIATGFGEYLALPLLRKAYRDDMTVEEGKKVLEETMKVLFYRDARTIDRVEIASVTQKGAEISEPFKLSTEWSYKAFVTGARAGDTSSW